MEKSAEELSARRSAEINCLIQSIGAWWTRRLWSSAAPGIPLHGQTISFGGLDLTRLSAWLQSRATAGVRVA